jgi:hypothetical protein
MHVSMIRHSSQRFHDILNVSCNMYVCHMSRRIHVCNATLNVSSIMYVCLYRHGRCGVCVCERESVCMYVCM